jgi:hypothetical protein
VDADGHSAPFVQPPGGEPHGRFSSFREVERS